MCDERAHPQDRVQEVGSMLWMWALLLVACGDKDGGGDGGTIDDAGGADGTTDSGSTDSGSTDSGSTDGGADSGTTDSGGPVDADGDGVVAGEDCDDGDPDRFPGNPERCDERDQDCDEEIDEDAVDRSPFWLDADDDGFGDPTVEVLACSAPPAHVANPDDCDDADPTRYPDAPEVCGDGVINACDGDGDDACAWAPGRDLAELELWRVALTDDQSGPFLFVEPAGDLDGDGVDDLLLGAPYAHSRNGALLLVPGAAGPGHTPAPTELRPGSSGMVHLGASLVALGDQDGDGHDEVLVGSPYVAGGALWRIEAPVAPDADFEDVAALIALGDGDDYLGVGASAGGDQDGDGVAELLLSVGALGSGYAGALRLVSGDLSDGLDLDADTLVTIEAGRSQLVPAAGRGTVVHQDLDGDGLLDLWLACPTDIEEGQTRGAVFGFTGDLPERASTDDADLEIVVDRSALLGVSMLRVPDADGDGLDEVALAAPYYGETLTASGAIFVVPQVAGDAALTGTMDVQDVAVARVEGGEAYDILGGAMRLHDVDGDGAVELLAGSDTQYLGSAASAASRQGPGALWTFALPLAGTATPADAVAAHRFEGLKLGYELQGAGDRNGDGIEELAVVGREEPLSGHFELLVTAPSGY